MNPQLYALITGGSQGFGKALALECAKRRMNLILVALPSSGLASLARFLRRNFGIDVICFEMDITKEENCRALHTSVVNRGLHVNMLINNAGILNGLEAFEERSIAFYLNQLRLNMETPTVLTHLFLDDLIAHSPSYILNVGSVAAFFHLPRMEVYGATKSYLLSFSRSLRMKLRQYDVHITTICPGRMNTTAQLCLRNQRGKRISRWSVMNPEDVARISIDKMLQKRSVFIPGFLNRLLIGLNKLTPDRVRQLLVEKEMQRLLARKDHPNA